MEIKITINVSGVDPIEIKVDVPVNEGEEPVKEEKSAFGPNARWFNEACTGWTKNAGMNKIFLIHQQEYCNEKLRMNGYLFLNEVYDSLGMHRTKRGQSIGWYYDEGDPGLRNFVDFGLFNEYNVDFINGRSDKVLLDFNVDGDILKYL